ncbi:MAG: hypothetical protein JWQ75_219 [Pseudarthrobacter sp.]|nr:hypothetical protein [Pseudarthrobacter sp.]
MSTTYPDGFDRPRTESPFLDFVAREFGRRGTERRGELAQKVISHPFVSGLGMKVPGRIALIEDLTALADADLPPLFVLKVANGWSSRGVMILERTGPDQFFDHMNLQALSLESILRIQAEKAESFATKKAVWIAEELIRHTLGVGAIPFDYKFYCFNGKVGLVVQIDRNTGPVKMALFDGEFRPLKKNTDYLLSGHARSGVPVIPLHAPEMLWWAQRLSREADSPFVSVDMLDSPDGPVFGEFTYSPGGTHRKLFVFSHAMLDRFDGLMGSDDVPATALSETSLEVRRSLTKPDALPYRAWAGYAYGGGPRGAERLHSFYKDLARECGPDDPKHDWYRWFSARWAGNRDRLRGGRAASKAPSAKTPAAV